MTLAQLVMTLAKMDESKFVAPIEVEEEEVALRRSVNGVSGGFTTFTIKVFVAKDEAMAALQKQELRKQLAYATEMKQQLEEEIARLDTEQPDSKG